MNTRQLSKKNEEYIISLRREFHRYPEVGLKEYRTSKKIKEELDKLEIPYIEAGGTGIIGIINGRNKGKTVALRSDIDALPINEENQCSYKSMNEGVMHACGHDSHMAMLLGAAKILKEIKNEFEGTVKLIFQPDEECGRISEAMIEGGMLEDVDTAFAIHVLPDIEGGKISIDPGPRMAGTDMFTIKVKGKGGHGAMPHQCVDAVVVAAAIVINLQTLVSREIDPIETAVVSIGQVIAGTKANIIAGEAELHGTLRYFNKELKPILRNGIKRIVESIAATYRAEASFTIDEGSIIPVINDVECCKIAARAIETIEGKEAIVTKEKMALGEDFSLYLDKVPGVMAFLGIRNEEKEAVYPLHHPRFQIDESYLELGAALHAQYVLEYLKVNK